MTERLERYFGKRIPEKYCGQDFGLGRHCINRVRKPGKCWRHKTSVRGEK